MPTRVGRWADSSPSRDAVVFLARGEDVTARATYCDLADRVAKFAVGLNRAGLAGEPVALSLPAGIDFVAIFLACLAARVIAIPLPHPVGARNLERLAHVLRDARPTAVISDGAGIARLAGEVVERDACRWLTVDALEADGAADPREPRPEEIAYVQYSSGSTRAPQGIAVTHGNLLANLGMMQAAYGLREGVVGVNWLPHHHDMGLVGTILLPLHGGSTAVLMPPQAFIQNPIRWLRAIDRFGATGAGGPSFGFDLCLRRVPEEAARQLDLSRWTVAYCGAEPVRATVLDRFAARFAAAGFDPGSFLPCYGLAEATLMVTSARPGEGVRRARFEQAVAAGGREYVSCGPPVPGGAVMIRDGAGAPLGEGVAGEICVSGPHVSPGSWQGAERRVRAFPGVFRDDRGDAWLPTGDLGIVWRGELYPIDRLKDTIVLRGVNLHAADIEATLLDAEADRGVLAAAAFPVTHDAVDSLMVLCEVTRAAARAESLALLGARIPKSIGERHGVVPTVAFLAPGALPRTSSGKIQRRRAKELHLAGALVPIGKAAATAPEDG